MDDKAKEAVERIRLKEQEENRRKIRNGIYVSGTAILTSLAIWLGVERSKNKSLELDYNNLKLSTEQKLNQADNKYNQLNANYKDVVDERNEFKSKYNNKSSEHQITLRELNSLNIKYDRTLAERDSLTGVVADVTLERDDALSQVSNLEGVVGNRNKALALSRDSTGVYKKALENLQMDHEKLYEAFANTLSWSKAIVKNRTFGYINQDEVNKMEDKIPFNFETQAIPEFKLPTNFGDRREVRNYIRNQLPN